MSSIRRRPRIMVTVAILAVTSAFALWIWRERQFIHERQAWLKSHDELIVDLDLVDNIPEAHIPPWRTWLGDKPLRAIEKVDIWSDNDRDNFARLFPESTIWDPYDPPQ